MALASVVFLLLLLLSIPVKAQQDQPNKIRPGASLSPNTTSWLSPSGIFAFGFYPQGNGFAVGIWMVSKPEIIVVWTANRDDPPVSSDSKIEFTTEGNLILQTAQGEGKSIADTAESAESASMHDSGNFILFDKNSHSIWESFNFPTDTILGGQNLSNPDKLASSKSRSDHSSSGRFLLWMQDDGNLVAYPAHAFSPQDAYWATGTFQTPVKLNLDTSGVLQLMTGDSNFRTLATSSSPCDYRKIIYSASLDADGNFRLYSHCFEGNGNSTLEWSALQNQCDVHGFCGFNSYCWGPGAEGNCLCYPGFVYLNLSEPTLGCYRSTNEDLCRMEEDPAKLYSLETVDNLLWVEDFPYDTGAMKSEDCGQSCLDDCKCDAALYRGGNCEKHTLPLRYGRRDSNISATAFFKNILNRSESNMSPPPVSPLFVKETKKGLVLILSSVLVSIACFGFVMAISSFFMYRHRFRQYSKLSENVNLKQAGEFSLKSFSYRELEKAANDFTEELGRGSFGAVYKGKIAESNKTVAIKRLETVVEEGKREFQAEMTVIGRTYHRNLVRLLGFCVDGSRKLLVYEYMGNGSLADLLFKSEKRPSWKVRVRIAQDVARGLVYLHEECEVQIIHHNIKPQNVLMDDSWTAKISDFGFAKLLFPEQIKTTMSSRDNRGHLAPEWKNDALTSVKTDVYSFGVLLLEIICCRRSIEINASTNDEVLLSSWVYSCFEAGNLEILVKDEDVELRTLERMVKVGLWCVQDDPTLRPSMKNVMLMLEGSVNVQIPPSPTPSLMVGSSC